MAREANHTPGPWRAAVDMDGRHQGISILTENSAFADEDAWPYHPLIATAFHGRHKADRATAAANATLMASAPELLKAIRSARPYVATCCEADGSDDASAALRQIDALLAHLSA